MVKSIKSALKRIFVKSRLDPRYIIFLVCFGSLLGVYLFSKSKDHQVKTIVNQRELSPSTKVISSNSEIYKRKDRIYVSKIKELENKLDQMHQQINEYEDKITKQNTEKAQKDTHLPKDLKRKENNPSTIAKQNHQIAPAVRNFETTLVAGPKPEQETKPRRKSTRKRAFKGPSIISFPVQPGKKTVGDTVTIPSGSFMKARLLTGIEAPEGKALPVLLQAEYAFIGPNKSQIDLAGCFLIAKSTGNLSIERVEMQVEKISCVSKTGKSFERKLSGFVADGKDNSFAIEGEVNSKRDQVAAMAFLSSVVDGISSAISKAQTTTVRDIQGSSTLISGSEKKFIAASGASSAASTITNWYLQHAEKLLPTINIGSGQEVWIIVQEKAQLPNWYFKKLEPSKGITTYLNNILH